MLAGTRRMALAACLAMGGCVARGGDDEADDGGRRSLTPTFVPADDPSTSTSAGPGASTDRTATTATTAGGGATEGTADAGGPTAVPTLRGGLSDPAGDVTLSPLDRPPRWADLRGGALERTGDGYRLSIAFDDAAPARSPDAQHTMNVAAFYDLDGDGHVDVEVWANLADTGWGPAVYDREGGRFGEESEVTIRRDRGQLVLSFPLDVLEPAERFRWSLASEWGTYDVIGTDLAARDDAPDGDRPAAFPR